VTRSKPEVIGSFVGLVLINALVATETITFVDWPETGFGEVNERGSGRLAAIRKLRPGAREYVWLRGAELAPFSALTKLSGYAKDIAEFYSLCGNQVSAFLGSIGVSA
jgi:hypothetical protein